MQFAQLLAKSVEPGGSAHAAATLQGHTAFVVSAAHELLEHRGAASLKAAGLSRALLPRLRRIVLVGAFAHDLGKSTDHFQAMVRHRRDAPQLLRHEAATLWLTWPGQPLSFFLESAAGSRDDLLLALCAAAGHHRKFWSRAVAPEEAGAGSSITILASHPDFARLLRHASSMIRSPLPDPPRLADLRIEVTRRKSPRLDLARWESEASRITVEQQPLLALAKALVLDADVAGSALARERERPDWIGAELSRRPDAAKLRGVVRARLGNAPPRAFQLTVSAAEAPVTLVRAGCGTGKTVAAYLWAAEQHPGRQLWITYPTTGTATEGFRDYSHHPDLPTLGVDLATRLEHSRADVDLEIFDLRDDDEGQRERDRLDALRTWGSEVLTCTVDTVLGVVQNNRKGLYAWPGLAHSAVVFDEIHAYDDSLFGALLRFLEALPGIPALLMTASLPSSRLSAVEDVVRRVHGATLPVIEGPIELERFARYVPLKVDPWDAACRCLSEGGKVLWVSNTVDRCMGLLAEARTRALPAVVYHSRFRYRDRVTRHAEVIDGFRGRGPILAATTQVAEMSLDLSADLLVTELAPIPALIQRLGRLNRRSTPDAPVPPKPFIVVSPASARPYDLASLHASEDWLERLGAQPLSQADLVRQWDACGSSDGQASPVASRWLDGGFSTEVGPLRDADFGITVLLPDDAAAVRRRSVRAMEVALPMPPPRDRTALLRWPRVQGLVVPPHGLVDYDPERGARWVA